MATKPTPLDVRDFLEGYNITTTIVSDTWITNEVDFTVIPFWEDHTRQPLFADIQHTEYYNGGHNLIMLHRRPFKSIDSIKIVGAVTDDNFLSITRIEEQPLEGIIKIRTSQETDYIRRNFPHGDKNVKIVYTVSANCPIDVKHALTKLTAILVLDMIEGRTGGGALTVKGFSRNYGKWGKYNNPRMRWSAQAIDVLRRHSTGLVGA